MSTKLDYKILNDERITICLEDKELLAFMPGADGEPCLKEGDVKFQYSIEQMAKNHIRISSDFTSTKVLSWIYPIFDAKIKQPVSVFKQGFGLGGPSGFVNIDDLQKENIIYSHGMIILKYNEGFMALYADCHTQYDNKYDVRTDLRNEIRYRLSAGFAIEKTISGGKLPNLHIYFNECLEQVLEQVATSIAEPYSPPVPKEPAYNWCSWYYYYNNLNYQQLEEFLNGMKNTDPQVPIKYVQIDAGYFPAAGDWLENNSLWPGGLKRAFDLIKSYGYHPGIWIAPFMVGNRSNLFKNHPDWMLRYTDSSYVTMWKWYNEPKVWGYQDEEYYVLDTSITDAMDYLRTVFKVLKEWGAEFFKTDFMLWGIQPSDKVLRHTPGATSVEYYRALMTMIREEIKDSYWLGCIAPFLPSLGFVNGMRIAGDVGAKWDGEGFGPEGMIQELVADNYFNGIYWQNDPDAVIMRNFHVFLKDHEIVSLCLLQAVSGGMVYTSDPLSQIDEKRLELFRFIRPDKIRRPDIPFLDKKQDLIVLHHRIDDSKHVILLFNPKSIEQTVFYQMSDIAAVKSMYTLNWTRGVFSTDIQCYIGGVIPSHECILLLGDESKPVDRNIENLWNW